MYHAFDTRLATLAMGSLLALASMPPAIARLAKMTIRSPP
jgi:hypothetical protein